MSQLRLDPLTGRWVVVSVDRQSRPHAFQPRAVRLEDDPAHCPFCPGHEEATPPAASEAKDADGNWLVRVVPNLYPAFVGNEPMAVTNMGPVFSQAPASGIHEVCIFTRDHNKTWADLNDDEASRLMNVVHDRFESHSGTDGLRYSQAIVNHGREAGASLEHPHAQLLGIPFVPRELTDEQAGFIRFHGNCLLCTTAEAESSSVHRVVYADEHVIVVCPFWSGMPFEMLVIPRAHSAHVHDADEATTSGVGIGVRTSLKRLNRALGEVAYNVVIHSAPYRTSADFHWHAHLLPKITTPAGFELGSGVLINIVAPEDAAEQLLATTL